MSNTEASELPTCRTHRRASAVVRPPIPSNLVAIPGKFSLLASLPVELHLHVISFLDLNDVIRLRRTCRHYYHYFTHDNLINYFSVDGRPTPELLRCCVNCFQQFDHVLIFDEVRWPSPWSSMCFQCFRVERSPAYKDRSKLAHIIFVDGEHGHVCSYCGWPVNWELMHRTCCKYANNSFERFLYTKWQDMFHVMILIPLLTIVCHNVMPTSVMPPGLRFFQYIPPVVEIYVYIHSLKKIADEDHYYLNQEVFWYPHFLIGPILVLLWLPLVIQMLYGVQINWNNKHAVEGGVIVACYFLLRLLIHAMKTIGMAIWVSGYDTRSWSLPRLSHTQKLRYILYSWLVTWWTMEKPSV
ncbi:hypothetical protein F4813DRAFT_401208 [Daldinia decipiens]|uniref:uncharacterized protein n=1 Tax=Daldinia decipiens TaxID=326647 RepID=UPI0020C5A33B|nr:uncharacterized protein F4813DRAFT_401208 [Daldinia decipiens]KAI1660269.1 hypothetical protein F4813DRAFT_401208 [Daldinia decipiens]